jgi:glycosyltransferase involved in cell wall biosynthesis
MKNIILITNKIFHYRIPIYNYFSEQFLNKDYIFTVITNEIQKDNTNKILFDLKIKKFNFFTYKKLINKTNPICVIVFLNLSHYITWTLIHWLRLKKIPVIYWGHSINLQDPKNLVKNIFFNYIHTISNSIILYSKNELKYISKSNRKKVFIANNTLNFNYFPNIISGKNTLKKKYNIPFEKIVLFVGRIAPRKRLEDLLIIFNKLKETEYGLIVIGPGLNNKYKKMIDASKNIIYFNEIYDKNKINEFFKLSDIFSIPGTNGLGLVQAFYWGLPAVTENVRHSPEIIYLKDGINGFIVDKGDTEALKDKIFFLLSNDDIYKRFSYNARKIIKKEASIERMFSGMLDSIKYVERSSLKK